MRIFTKKAFQFKNSSGEKITTSPLAFQDVPDWVAKNDLFKLAQKDGSAEIIESSKEEKAAEKAAAVKAAKEAAAAEKAAKEVAEKAAKDEAEKKAVDEEAKKNAAQSNAQ
jgi:hypothetical protein